jgi:hypothetical protein
VVLRARDKGAKRARTARIGIGGIGLERWRGWRAGRRAAIAPTDEAGDGEPS